MSDCTQCPHVVGDSFDRDCCFPDCSGGWEEVCKQLQAELQECKERLDQELDWDESQDGFKTARKEYIATSKLITGEGFSKIEPITGEEYSLFGLVCNVLSALQADRAQSVKLKQLLDSACFPCCDGSGGSY